MKKFLIKVVEYFKAYGLARSVAWIFLGVTVSATVNEHYDTAVLAGIIGFWGFYKWRTAK